MVAGFFMLYYWVKAYVKDPGFIKAEPSREVIVKFVEEDWAERRFDDTYGVRCNSYSSQLQACKRYRSTHASTDCTAFTKQAL